MSDAGRGGGTARTGISILCRNLPIDIGPEEVKDAFAAYGEIRDVYLPKDHYSGRAKGFGFIEFSDARDADDAVRSLDNSTIGGRTVSVIHSKQTRKTPRDMARREETGPRPPTSDRSDRRRNDDRDYRRRDDRDRSYKRRVSLSRSRSPRRRRRHRSRDSRGGSGSPPSRRGGNSPIPRRRTYSRDESPTPPTPPRRSRSPLARRYDSRSPIPRRYSRSPARQRRLSSPLPFSPSRSAVIHRSLGSCSRSPSHSISPVLRRLPPPQSSSPIAASLSPGQIVNGD